MIGIQVYCTNCEHFRLDDEWCPHCPFENRCNIWDCNDSKDIFERPKYKQREEIHNE